MLQDDLTLAFTAPLWRWEARRELWTFVSLPAGATDDIRELGGDLPRGFGAITTHARVGPQQWWTSVFPQHAGSRYVLPVKKQVREANRLALGDEVRVWLQLHP